MTNRYLYACIFVTINKLRKLLKTCYSFYFLLLIHVKTIINKNKKYTKNEKLIILVSEFGHVRVVKIAKALNHVGIKPMLITKNKEYINNPYFSSVLIYRNNYKLAYWAIKNYRTEIFHFFCNWNYDLPAIFIKFSLGKVIIDSFDILNYFTKPAISRLYADQVALEHYCMSNSNGIVCRDLRTNVLRKHGWKLPQRILFMEYADSKPCQIVEKVLQPNLVYLGNLDTNPMSAVAFQYELAEALDRAKITFTIYPSFSELKVSVTSAFNKLNPKLMLNGYLEISKKLNFSDLRNEIQSKSFGLLISSKHIAIDNNHDTYYPILNRYFFAAKIFDYYEVGIFPIVQHGSFIQLVLKRMKIGTTVSSYNEITKTIKTLSGTSITAAYNKSLTLEGNAHRLLAFYKTL